MLYFRPTLALSAELLTYPPLESCTKSPEWENSTDPKVCETAKAYSAALTESQAKAFENAVPTAVWFGCVVRIITSFCRTKRTCYVKCGPFSVACGSG